MVFYTDPGHCTCIVSAYNVGRQAPRGNSTIYQQQLRYIQTHGLDSTPSRLFTIDFVAQLRVWQRQGDRLLLFMDMNEHILTGRVARHLLAMGLQEATHLQWGEREPHTYVRGLEPIDAVWHSQGLDVVSTLQLSFHEGVGDHRLVLADITTKSAIGKQEFKVVHPHGRCISSQNNCARTRYLRHLEQRCAPTGWLSTLAPVSRGSPPILHQQKLSVTCKPWTCKWQKCSEEVNVSVE